MIVDDSYSFHQDLVQELAEGGTSAKIGYIKDLRAVYYPVMLPLKECKDAVDYLAKQDVLLTNRQVVKSVVNAAVTKSGVDDLEALAIAVHIKRLIDNGSFDTASFTTFKSKL